MRRLVDVFLDALEAERARRAELSGITAVRQLTHERGWDVLEVDTEDGRTYSVVIKPIRGPGWGEGTDGGRKAEV